MAREALEDLLVTIAQLDERITSYDTKLRQIARQDRRITRLMTLPGVGEASAGALVATIGNGQQRLQPVTESVLPAPQ